jgi:S1-C subfamily serine protease
MVIRGFDKDSLAPNAGLQVGDRIVELDGNDVLRQKRLVDCCLSWTVGEDVVVTFLRNGTRMTTQAKTIAN